MIVRHELRLQGVCPVDGSVDHYDVTVETTRLLPVERVVLVVREAAAEPAFQEEIARAVANRLGPGVAVTLVGFHSGVKTTVEAGPLWEKELESAAS